MHFCSLLLKTDEMSAISEYPCSLTASNWSFHEATPSPAPTPTPTPTPAPGPSPPPPPPPAKRNYLFLYVLVGIIGLFLLFGVFK